MAAKNERAFKVVADNRKARFNYEIGDTFEAGIALTGTEVKSLRVGKAAIAEAYADARSRPVDPNTAVGAYPREQPRREQPRPKPQ